MVYLRARQYAPGMGRFLTRDTWGGNASAPMSYNLWNYVNSNPTNRLDPSGYCYIDDLYGTCLPYDSNYNNPGVTVATSSTSNLIASIAPLVLISQYTNCSDTPINNSKEGVNFNSLKGVDALLLDYGVELATGTGGKSGGWNPNRKQAVLDAVSSIGSAFTKFFFAEASVAFRIVYKTDKTPLVLVWGDKLAGMPYWEEKDNKGKVINSEHIGAGCLTKGYTSIDERRVQVIKCVSLSGDPSNLLRMRNTIVHELGHLFQVSMGSSGWNLPTDYRPYEKLSKAMQSNPLLRRGRDPNKFYGFAGPSNIIEWQQHGCYIDKGSGSGDWACEGQAEVFADQFLGWTFNTWEKDPSRASGWSDAGEARSTWMNDNMATWLNYVRIHLGG